MGNSCSNWNKNAAERVKNVSSAQRVVVWHGIHRGDHGHIKVYFNVHRQTLYMKPDSTCQGMVGGSDCQSTSCQSTVWQIPGCQNTVCESTVCKRLIW